MKFETYKWLYQRVSTPFIIILSLWLIYNAYTIEDYNYETIIIFFENYLNLFFFILFIFLSLFHTAIEVFHAVDDYFLETRNEKMIKYLINILYIIVLFSLFFFIYRFIYNA